MLHVPELFQHGDFSDRRKRHPFLAGMADDDLLQGHKILGCIVLGLVDGPVGPCANFLDDGEVVSPRGLPSSWSSGGAASAEVLGSPLMVFPRSLIPGHHFSLNGGKHRDKIIHLRNL